MAPPPLLPEARLFRKVEFRIAVGLTEYSAPPIVVELLLLNTQLWIVRRELGGWKKIPAPFPPLPLAMVRPEIEVGASEISNTRFELLPLMVRIFALGPMMVVAAVMSNVEARVITPVTMFEKTIRWPPPKALLVSMACRREPVPLLFVFTTVKVFSYS